MPKEKLVLIHATLAFALPEGANPDEVYDSVNMALIPLQRREGSDSGLIDYMFYEDAVVSPTPVEGYNYDEGFKEPTDTFTDKEPQ